MINTENEPRIAYLTSGAAGMYCGSCMHDNTLARSLGKMGVDIQLIPTYTPIRTDENDVSIDQVFFGGINVFLQQKIPLFRHLPRFVDRFLDNPWIIKKATSRSIDVDARVLGELTVSMLKGLKGNQRKEVKRLSDWLRTHARPDLLVLTNILIGGCIPHLKESLGIPAIVTLQGDDIFLNELPEPSRSQAIEEIKRLVPHVDRFISHSVYYADMMAEMLSIPRDKISVTPLGIDLNDFQVGDDSNGSSASSGLAESDGLRPSERKPTIGYLARLAPEKGLHVLADAFIRLHQEHPELDARLKIAGWLGDHRKPYAEEQFDKLRTAGLGDKFQYVGSIERHEKVDFLQQLDLLSVPTVYQEPKGLFVLEALACGVPVLLPEHGAFPEIMQDTGGGLLFPPQDADALTAHLATLLQDQSEARRLGATGQIAVTERRNSTRMAEQTKQLFLDVLAGTPSTAPEQEFAGAR